MKKNNSQVWNNNHWLRKDIYLHLKLIQSFYGKLFSSKWKLFSETSYIHRQLLCTWGFLALYFGLLTDMTQNCQAVSSLRQSSKYKQLAVHYSWMMNSENSPKEIVQLVIDLANMVKGLMDENQQLSVTEKLGRLFPSARDGGRSGESRRLLRVVAGESSASTTDTNRWFKIEIWGSRATSNKPQKSMSHKTT